MSLPESSEIQAALEPLFNRDGALLSSWAVVVERLDENGDPRLGRAWSNGTPTWKANGMFHEALYGNCWEDEADG